MIVARIIVDWPDCKVFAPFAYKDLIKSFPGRRWNATEKCWTVSVTYVDDLADTLRASGCTVYLTRPNGDAWKSGRTNHGHRDKPADNWATTLFKAVGSDRVGDVHRALTKCLHPDRPGGDAELMQQLNTARDQAKFQHRRTG